MRIIVYSIYAYLKPHFEIELEIIKKNLEQGNEVFVVKCGMALDSCMWNVIHDPEVCAYCQSRAFEGFKITGIKEDHLLNLKKNKDAYKVNIPFFKTSEELKNFSFDSNDIGLGVYSSLVSQNRDPDINSYYEKERIEKTCCMAINVHLNFKELLPSIKPDAIYFFNGRLAELRPLIKLAERFHRDYFTYEVAMGTIKKYIIFENTFIHDQKYIHKKIIEFWENSPLPDKESEGLKWFTDRRNGVAQANKVFILDQSKNKLPANFNHEIKNIAIFNHSDDEFVTFPGWNIPLFNNQNNAIREIVEHFGHYENFHFYLRMHPNLPKVETLKVRKTLSHQYKNLTVIEPKDDIDTYALLDACDSIITFGSTVGIEATVWNKPSIFIGMSYYRDLDCTYIPESVEEVFELIEKDIKPKDKLEALKYGFWFGHFGNDYIYYKTEGQDAGTFMGKKIELDPIMQKYDNIKNTINNNWWGKPYRFVNKLLFIPNILRRTGFYKFFYSICYKLSEASYLKSNNSA
jgi:hypothetical protein